MVDEYQDTSCVQERALLRLAQAHGNIAVVGDDDQSIYRFRGASVRNLLEFPERFREAAVIRLTVNYRSHPGIVRAFDRWMASADWTNPKPGGPPFRHDKAIRPHAAGSHPDYTSVIAVLGNGPRDEARQLAELLRLLKTNEVIANYAQVALLLHSVRERFCREYLTALAKSGIPHHRAPAATGLRHPASGASSNRGVSADRHPHRPRTGDHHPPGERLGVAGSRGGLAGRFRRRGRHRQRVGRLQPLPSLRATQPHCGL